MKTDEFLVEFFKDSDEVTVKAVELQKLYKKKRTLEEQLEKALEREEKLQHKLWGLESKIEFYELEKPLHVDLRI